MFHSNVSLPEGRSDRRSCVRNPSQKSFPGDPGSVASSSSATELLQSAYNAAEEDQEFECSCSLAGNGWEWLVERAGQGRTWIDLDPSLGLGGAGSWGYYRYNHGEIKPYELEYHFHNYGRVWL